MRIPAARWHRRQSTRGQAHQVVLRALAFKWIRVLWKCWQTRTPYDEARHLHNLQRHHSPYALTPTSTS